MREHPGNDGLLHLAHVGRARVSRLGFPVRRPARSAPGAQAVPGWRQGVVVLEFLGGTINGPLGQAGVEYLTDVGLTHERSEFPALGAPSLNARDRCITCDQKRGAFPSLSWYSSLRLSSSALTSSVSSGKEPDVAQALPYLSGANFKSLQRSHINLQKVKDGRATSTLHFTTTDGRKVNSRPILYHTQSIHT